MDVKNNRIIFLGSFDPFHDGHFGVVKRLKTIHNAYHGGSNFIHIIPAHQNPNKEKYMFTYNERKVMIAQSVFLLDNTAVIIDDIEPEMAANLKDGENLYTINVLKEFRRRHYNDIITWALTQETYDEIKAGKWYKGDECLLIPDSIEIINTLGIPDIHSKDIRNAILAKDKQFLENNMLFVTVDFMCGLTRFTIENK